MKPAFTDMSWSGEDGKLDAGKSGFFTAYTSEMKSLNRSFRSQRSVHEDEAYLFVFDTEAVNEDEDSGVLLGDMPIGYQFGYLFSNSLSSVTAKTIAHELGHGIFQLNHTFESSYAVAKSSTNNLMDYTEGVELVKQQWDAIYDPQILVTKFLQDDEEGELLGAKLLTTYELQKLCYQYKLVKDAQYHLVNTGILPYEEVFLFASKDDLDTYKELRKKSSYDAKSKILKTYTYWGVNTKEKLENMFKKADEKCVCPISFNDFFMDSDEKFQELVNSIKLHLQCNNENYQFLSSEDVSISGGITVLNDSFTLPNGEKLDDGSFYINKGSEKTTKFESYTSEKSQEFMGNNDIYFFFGKRDKTKDIEKSAPIVIKMDEEDAGKFIEYLDEGDIVYKKQDSMIQTYRDKSVLTIEEIKLFRDQIALIEDENTKKELYLELQKKVPYHTQLDNEFKPAVTCNQTSLAMCLEGLGIEKTNTKDMQFEDEMELYRKANSKYRRTDIEARKELIKHYGATYKVLSRIDNDFETLKSTLLPELEKGHMITFSYGNHIVRLKEIRQNEIVVDDPYGCLSHEALQKRQSKNGNVYCSNNSKSTKIPTHAEGCESTKVYAAPCITNTWGGTANLPGKNCVWSKESVNKLGIYNILVVMPK